MKSLLFVLLVCLSQALGDNLPTPQILLQEYDGKLKDISRNLYSGLEAEKGEWVGKLTSFRDESRLFGNMSDWLWAERMLSMTDLMGRNWPGLFAEELPAPEGIKTLKKETHGEVRELKKSAQERTKQVVTEYKDKFALLEKRLVQANRIEEALVCQERSGQVEKSKTRRDLLNTLKRFEAKTFWKQDRKRRSRTHKKLEEVGVPPNARYPFRSSNPAFESFVKSVKAASAGKAAGPMSGIKLGQLVDYRGTRGLAVIAVFNKDVLIEDTFDTYAELSESERLTKAIHDLPYGSFVVMAVKDDATRRFSGSAQSTLKRLGALEGLQNHSYQGAYILIGAKGLFPGQAAERSDATSASYP